MKNNSGDKNRSFNPFLTVVLIITIIALAWLSIRLINIMPGAFSSLASLAETVRQEPVNDGGEDLDSNDTDLSYIRVNSDTNMIDVGEDILITWDNLGRDGKYVFSYRCAEGLSLESYNTAEDRITLLDCAVEYETDESDELIIQAQSEKNRLTTVDYTINFIPENSTIASATGNDSFVVINDNIGDDTNTNEEEVEEEPVEEAGEETVPEPEVSYEPEYSYIIPVSDSNGRTDLAVRFLQTGRIVGDRFIPGAIERDENGAIQFEVKNYGTKTSGDWSYRLNLPIGGDFEAEDQEPLKPNERAVITIGFTADDDSRHEFIVRIDESSDQNSLNDAFRQTVRFEN
jgi:hypothetical protein